MNSLRSLWWKVEDFTRDRWEDLRDFLDVIGPTGWFLIVWFLILAGGLVWGVRFAQELEKDAAAKIHRSAP